MRIYVTHCSAKKDDSLKGSSKEVGPDVLYTGMRIHAFITACKRKNVRWVIFSDQYGIWFPEIQHAWYEKSPDSVTETQFQELISDFDTKLESFDEIWFYYNPGRFHYLYDELLKRSKLRDRVKRFTHVTEISSG